MRSFESRTRFYHRTRGSRFLFSLARITEFKDQRLLASSETGSYLRRIRLRTFRAHPNFSHSAGPKVHFFHCRDSYFKPSFPLRSIQPSRLTFHPHRHRLCPMQLLSPCFLFRLVASLSISCLSSQNTPIYVRPFLVPPLNIFLQQN